VVFVVENVESARLSAMFVFGDSYIDIENLNEMNVAWKYPYGIRFPGKSSERHSYGKFLTNFIGIITTFIWGTIDLSLLCMCVLIFI
jgi:phospholipase/lecithinase/hemolysin